MRPLYQTNFYRSLTQPHDPADAAEPRDHHRPGGGLGHGPGSYRGDGVAHRPVEAMEDELIIEVGAAGLDRTSRNSGSKIRHRETDVPHALVAEQGRTTLWRIIVPIVIAVSIVISGINLAVAGEIAGDRPVEPHAKPTQHWDRIVDISVGPVKLTYCVPGAIVPTIFTLASVWEARVRAAQAMANFMIRIGILLVGVKKVIASG